MLIKYLLQTQEATLVMKFNPANRELIVGGNGRHTGEIMILVQEYFGREKKLKSVWTQKNKVRFICKINEEDFEKGRAKMLDDGITMELRQNVGRIMR